MEQAAVGVEYSVAVWGRVARAVASRQVARGTGATGSLIYVLLLQLLLLHLRLLCHYAASF